MMEEGGSGLTKVVLARRSDVQFRGTLDPLLLLEALQERDPRAYQFCLQLPAGAAFLGSSPEQLYSRTGRCVASEAVAATRARGPPGVYTCVTPDDCLFRLSMHRDPPLRACFSPDGCLFRLSLSWDPPVVRSCIHPWCLLGGRMFKIEAIILLCALLTHMVALKDFLAFELAGFMCLDALGECL